MNSWIRRSFLTLLLSILTVQAQQAPNHSCISLDGALRNGYVAYEPRGPGENSLVRFCCNPGFTHWGPQYSTCENGRWTEDFPVCISVDGCPALSADPQRHDFTLFRSKIITVRCDPGYSLKFKPLNETLQLTASDREFYKRYASDITLHCISGAWNVIRLPIPDYLINDPSTWNNFIPVSTGVGCEIADNGNATSYRCDFEESLCGWRLDRAVVRHCEAWDWTQSTPEQTLGVNQTGRYLYIDGSTPRTVGEKSRLFSPVFHQNLTGVTQACFRFRYHMFSPAVVALRVFVLERGQVFAELKPKAELVGEQGNEWRLAEVQLKTCDNCSQLTPFQIVLEGEIGRSNHSDIAIDDVHLMMGEECRGGNETIINIEGMPSRRLAPIPWSAEIKC